MTAGWRTERDALIEDFGYWHAGERAKLVKLCQDAYAAGLRQGTADGLRLAKEEYDAWDAHNRCRPTRPMTWEQWLTVRAEQIEAQGGSK